MKVHIHTPSFFPALVGMTYATHEHARLLGEIGADVTVIAPESATETTDTAGCRVRTFGISGSGLPWSPLRGDIDGLLRFTEQDRPEIVIAEGWFTPGAALLPQLRKSARHTVLSSHGTADRSMKAATPSQAFRSLSYRWVERREQKRIVTGLSAAILLTGYRDNDRFRDAALFERHAIPSYICPNPSTYAPRAVTPHGARRHGLLHVGALTGHKNQLLAVETLAGLPQPFRLTLAFPEWTPYGDIVMAAAERLGVRERVTTVQGHDRTALEPLFDAHDLLLITSRSEAQPIIAADALRKAMPYVSTPVGCMPEFRGGIVTDPADLRDAVVAICSDADTYVGYSRAASDYYTGALSRSHSLRALREMLLRLSASE